MTFWAKFLTVVILVLAIMFAAISATLFAKRDEFRKANDNLTKQMNDAQANAEKQLRKAGEAVQKLDAEYQRMKVKMENAQATSAVLDRQLNQELDKNKSYRAVVETLNTKLGYLEAERKTYDEKEAALKMRRDQLEKQVSELSTNLQNEQKENQQLRKTKEDLTNTLQATREKLHGVTQEYERMTTLVADVGKVWPQVQKYIEGRAAIPTSQIVGKVIAVDEANGNVIINVGHKAGVKEQFQFLIHRGTKLVGGMVIFALEKDDLSAGKIQFLNKGAEGKPLQVRVGDDVVTGLGF